MADRADNGIRKQDNYGTADCANIIAPDGEYEQMEPLDKAAGFRIRPGPPTSYNRFSATI